MPQKTRNTLTGIREFSENRITLKRFTTWVIAFSTIKKNVPLKSSLLLFLLPYLTFGQNAHTIVKDSLENYKLVGKVKQVDYSRYEARVVNDTFLVNSEINLGQWPNKLIFSLSGMLMEKSHCNMYGNECRRNIIRYGKNQMPTKYQEIEQDSIVIAQEEYHYSTSNQLINKVKYLWENDNLEKSDSLHFKYDHSNRLQQVNRYDGNNRYKGKLTYQYGNGKSEWIVFEEINSEFETEKHIEKKLDEKGRIIEKITYDQDVLLFKTLYQYKGDSLVFTENFFYENGKFKLRDATHNYYSSDYEKSSFEINISNQVRDTVKYEYVVFNNLGRTVFRQTCKNEILYSETSYKYNKLGQLAARDKVNYAKSIYSNWLYEYYPNSKLKSEKLTTNTGMIKLNKWYYDVIGNWTHRIEKTTTSDLSLTHLHKQDIIYFD